MFILKFLITYIISIISVQENLVAILDINVDKNVKIFSIMCVLWLTSLHFQIEWALYYYLI